MTNRVVEKGLILAVAGLVVAVPVYAYLDPGSGSFITQVIVASLVGGLVAFRTSVRRAFGWFRATVFRRKS